MVLSTLPGRLLCFVFVFPHTLSFPVSGKSFACSLGDSAGSTELGLFRCGKPRDFLPSSCFPSPPPSRAPSLISPPKLRLAERRGGLPLPFTFGWVACLASIWPGGVVKRGGVSEVQFGQREIGGGELTGEGGDF